MTEFLPVIMLCLLGVVSILCIWVLVKMYLAPKTPPIASDLERLERLMRQDAKDLRQELSSSLVLFNDSIRSAVNTQMDKMRTENGEKLEQMRTTVDEKLHTTLEKRLGESFSLVSERLEKVHQGLGEMQSLAADVGGLKRVLTNVKTRGVWGEVQLGALLEQMLSPDQYVKNARVRDNTTEMVEFAIKLPDGEVLIPLDSKFPIENYDRLAEAAERGDVAAIESAAMELERNIKTEAKRICEKYINPPQTTDFAIMFLPTEGLYAEVIRRGSLAADIQMKYRVSIAGPTTLGAFLNSLQMGFRSLAIQKRSGEVWKILGEAKAEFERYAGWVEKVKKKIEDAHKTLDEAETRTRKVNIRLRGVESTLLPTNDTGDLLEDALPSLGTPSDD